jgi:gamma-glutamyltranspeptidase/glutathione hydrolase
VLARAVDYAATGFPASPLLVGSARTLPAPLPVGAESYRDLDRPGQRIVRPGAARALQAIAGQGRDGFYGGEFGDGLLALGQGEYTPDDLARPLAEWVAPLGLRVWEHDLWTVPPPSQGYLTLAGAWLAERDGLLDDPDDGSWAVALVGAAMAAGRDRPEVLWDGADGVELLAPSRLARLGSPSEAVVAADRARRDRRRATADTTYLCTVDGQGMGVSLIQSNAAGFGSHLFEPGTGINLHNRGIGFSLEPGHPAEYGPGRRPPHTLSPAVVTRPDGELHAVLGTQGGDGQPQILLQVLARLLHADQSPGRAIASRRWVLTGSGQGFDTWTAPGGPTVVVEDGAPPAWADALADAGNTTREGAAFDHGFGHAHLIVRRRDGMLAGAADPRARIGTAAGF